MDEGMYNKDLMNQRAFDGFTVSQERSKTYFKFMIYHLSKFSFS